MQLNIQLENGKKNLYELSTMMNKVLEVIEAFKLFPFNKNKYEIVIHPQSLFMR